MSGRARRLTLAVAVGMLVGVFPGVAGAAGPMFTQCPPVGLDTGCQYLLTITDHGYAVQTDPAQRPYEGVADSLVGIQNNSSRMVQSVQLTSSRTAFNFDGDGLCNNSKGPAPTGCQPPPGSSAVCNPSLVNTNHCSFPPPPGEPPNYIEPGATNYGEESAAGPVPNPWPNGDLQNGYEGPGTWFSNISASMARGVVNFSPALAPGQSTYFSLEEPLTSVTAAVVNVPLVATATRTRLSGDGLSGSKLTVPNGAPVTDRAFIAGHKASSAGGTVNYAFFSNKGCTVPAGKVSSASVSKGVAGRSARMKLAPGTYYARATYSGDTVNSPSVSACGSEVLRVAKRFRSGLPSGRMCVAARTLRFHLRGPKHVTAKFAYVEINGKVVKRVRLRKKPPLVVLQKLPRRGRYHIEIIVVAKHGMAYEDSHIFHACGKKH